MAATIYYFTGTGNSLHAAKAVAEALGEARVVNIARQKGEAIEDKSDVVGIVFPVHYYNMPHIVRDFVKKLRLSPDAYVFAIATCGGGAGNSLSDLNGFLLASGGRLAAGFELVMPDNAYIGMNLVTPEDERDGVLKAAEGKLQAIIEVVKKSEKAGFKSGGRLGNSITGSLGHTFAMRIYRLPKRFKTNDKCDACGICERICPKGNITRDGKKITWGNDCTQCLACFHWCPRTAIEIGGRSAKVARYHHPAIELNDMIK